MPLSAAIFRRGGPKKELFEAVADDKGAEEVVDDEAELEDNLKELQELLHSDKSGCVHAGGGVAMLGAGVGVGRKPLRRGG